MRSPFDANLGQIRSGRLPGRVSGSSVEVCCDRCAVASSCRPRRGVPRVHQEHLPGVQGGGRRRGQHSRQQGVPAQAVPRPRRVRGAGLRRRRDVRRHPRFNKPGTIPLRVPDRGPRRLPARLRAVPGPQAARLPGADRGQHRLQPRLPGLLRRLRPPARRVLAHPRAGGGGPRRVRGRRGRARGGHVLRRRAVDPPADPRVLRHGPRQGRPLGRAQHQRHPPRPRPQRSPPALAELGVQDLPAVRRPRRSPPTSRSGAATCGRPRRRRWTAAPTPAWPCMLVAAVERRASTPHELGAIVRHGIAHPAVRGVVFQPVTHAGRHAHVRPAARGSPTPTSSRHSSRSAPTGSGPSDFFPVPCCFPTCRSITYLLADEDDVMPIPRLLPMEDYLDYVANRALPDPSACAARWRACGALRRSRAPTP